MSWSDTLGTSTQQVPLTEPKVFKLTDWRNLTDPGKMEVINRISDHASMDPRIATKTVEILRASGVEPRDYVGQLKVLLAWVQENIYYVNEQDERLQDPHYTLQVRYGDCDDSAILLMSFVKSLRLPARPVISGVKKNGRRVRYILGQPGRIDPTVKWSHIYVQVGDRPFNKNVQWYFAEPTLKVPLGWDVVSGNPSDVPQLPELGGPTSSSAAQAGGAAASSATGLLDEEQILGVNWKGVMVAVLIGSLTASLTQLVVEGIRSVKESRESK